MNKFTDTLIEAVVVFSVCFVAFGFAAFVFTVIAEGLK
jgi:hypothetical protein